MNAHIPQSIPTITELKKLATLRNHVISPRLNAPTVTVIQDTLSGVYRLTRSKVKIPEQEAMNIIARWDLPLKSFPRKEYYTGQDMLSFILPKLSGKFGKVLVEMGKVKAGQFDKNALISESALIHTIYNDFGPDQTARFIDQLQALIHKYFLVEGFSVGIEDMLTSVENTTALSDAVESNMKKAEELIKKVHEGKFTNNTGRSNAEEFEFEIQNITKNITTASTKLVATLDADNRTMAMVNSGAKANEMNVAQMMALLGQQNIEGGRAPYTFEGRTLPHFPKYDDGLESRGFVKNSFLTGLTPFEYFFHAAAGRIGMIDTAVKSVTKDTKIMIQDMNGNMNVVKIGEWIDGLIDGSSKEDITQYGPEDANMELLKLSEKDCVFIPTIDMKGNTIWSKLTAVTRHDPGEKLYKIETTSGREVTVTAAQSLLVWNKDKDEFEARDAPSVSVGDFLPTTMSIGAPEKIIDKIDMAKYLPKNEYIYGTDFHLAIEMMESAMEGRDKIPTGWWEEHNGVEFTLPYEKKAKLQRAATRSGIENIKAGYIYPYHATRQHAKTPEYFELNEENGIMLGLYLADGNCHEGSGQIHITKNNESVRAFAKKWFENMGIKTNETKQSSDRAASVAGYSTMMVRVFESLCGKGSANKHVPVEAYSAPDSFVIGILNGYFSGDGTVGDGAVGCTSISKDLIDGISALCNRMGIFGKMSYNMEPKPSNLCSNPKPQYRFDIRAQWAKLFMKKIPLVNTEKQFKLNNLKPSEEHRNYTVKNGVVLDAIKTITPVDPELHPKMYDVTVPETLNFNIFNGLCMRDTSETGYLQRQFMKMMEDLKVEHDGTVRNSMKRMVQFRYGDDSIDPVKIETVEIDLAKMSNADITREFGLSMSDLEAVLTSAAIKEVTQPIKDMVSAVRADREMFIKNIIRYNSKKPALRVAVHLPRLLNTYKNVSSSTTDLTPDYVYQKISEFERKSFVKNPAFNILLHYVLAPKKVIVEARLTVELFDALMAEMEYKYLKALVHPSESVGPVAAQSIGEPTTQLTLNSIEWNERIMVKNGDKIMDVKIGEFIDDIMSKTSEDKIEVHPNDTKLAYMPESWDALSVDEEGVVSWKKLEAVTRHPPINEDGSNTLVRVKTKGGRNVTATKAKSFLAKSPEGKLEATRGDELQVGSLVPIMVNFPEANIVDTINVYDYVEKKTKFDKLPQTIKLDYNFGLFVGAYVAEGMSNAHMVCISNNDADFKNGVMKWVEDNNIHYHTVIQENKIQEGWKTSDYRITNTQLARLMGGMAGKNALTKYVPDFVYNAPIEFVKGFLNAYISGDGTVGVDGRRCIAYASSSEKLIDGVMMLLTRFGVHSRKSQPLEHKNSKHNAKPSWQVRIPVEECIKLREHLTLLIKYKQERLDAIEPTGKFTKSRSTYVRVNDIVWDPVVSIEEVASEYPYVYDLTVADTKNFIHSNGLCLRDTFHVAGTAAANSTSGVPRIKELAAASKNPKTPSNYVYLKGDLVTNKDAALQLKKNIQQTRLKDVLKAVRIYYDPTEESVVEEDKEFMGEYLDAFRAKGGDAESSPWVIRIELSEADLADRAITLEKIKYELEQTSGVADVKVSDTNSSNLIVRVRMVALKGEGNEFFEARKAIYDLENVILSGIDGINRVFLKESSEEFFYDPVENVYKAKKPWLLETEGANLIEILGHPDVDATRSFSNDIMEIQEIFGIEVARQALIDEFRLALGSAYVNVHHVMLLVDTMVQNGYIGPVGRHSMNKNTDIGPLAKASFETSGKVVVEASVAGELDTITGVSSNIMLGQIPPCGTGDVAVFIDESMLPAIKKEVEPELIPVPEAGKKELTMDDIVLDLGF